MATTDASLAAAKSVDALAAAMRRASASATSRDGRSLADAGKRGQLAEFVEFLRKELAP